MTRPGLYLCGCDPKIKSLRYGYSRIDKLGFDVCPEHGERLYGWASPKADPSTGLPDWTSKSLDSKPLNLNFSTTNNLDNRDPVLVYAMMKAVEEDDIASANGHTEPSDQ